METMKKRIDWLHVILSIALGIVLKGWILARVGWAECIAGHDVDHIYVYEWELEKAGITFGEMDFYEGEME
jgi:hypothetical protein